MNEKEIIAGNKLIGTFMEKNFKDPLNYMFDFSQDWKNLDVNTKANFLSFIKIGLLPKDKEHPLYKKIADVWNAYQKHNKK